MEKENRYKGIRTVHPNRLTPKGIVILILIGILLLALALYFIPWPERMELQMNGAKVDTQGNVITEGEIVVEGWRYHYLFQSDKFRLTKIELPGVKIKWIVDVQGDSGFSPWPRELISTGLCFLVQNDDYWRPDIITTEDYDFVVIHEYRNNYVFIGTAEGTPDYVQILDRCYLLED